MGSCALVWSVTSSGVKPERTIAGSTSAAFPSSPIESAVLLRLACCAVLIALSSEVVAVQVFRLQPAFHPRGIHLNADADAAGELYGEGLCAAHAAKSSGDADCAGQCAVEMLLCCGLEGLVRALQNPLRSDVDPGARGHLTVHHQARGIQPVELLPICPARHQVRICYQNAWRTADAFSARHGFPDRTSSVSSFSKRSSVSTMALNILPVARSLTSAAVYNQLLWLFGNIGIQVVHQHPLGCFLDPAAGRPSVSTWCPNLRVRCHL